MTYYLSYYLQLRNFATNHSLQTRKQAKRDVYETRQHRSFLRGRSEASSLLIAAISPRCCFIFPIYKTCAPPPLTIAIGECVYDMIRCLVWHDTNTTLKMFKERYSPALELLSGLICLSTPLTSRNPIGRILLPNQVAMCSSEIAFGRCLLRNKQRACQN